MGVYLYPSRGLCFLLGYHIRFLVPSPTFGGPARPLPSLPDNGGRSSLIVHRSSVVVDRRLFVFLSSCVARDSSFVFVLRGPSFVVRCASFVVPRSSFIVRRFSCVLRRSFFVARRVSFIVRRSFFVGRHSPARSLALAGVGGSDKPF